MGRLDILILSLPIHMQGASLYLFRSLIFFNGSRFQHRDPTHILLCLYLIIHVWGIIYIYMYLKFFSISYFLQLVYINVIDF